MTFTKDDLEFLKSVGISSDDLLLAASEEESSTEHDPTLEQPDGTMKLLEECGIPLTRENYLLLAFMGTPPSEPLDGEIEAELPWQVRGNDRDE